MAKISKYRVTLFDGKTIPSGISVLGEFIKVGKDGTITLDDAQAKVASGQVLLTDASDKAPTPAPGDPKTDPSKPAGSNADPDAGGQGGNADGHRGPITKEELEPMKGPDLRKLAEGMGIILANNASKAQMIEAILAKQAEADQQQ